MARILKGWNTKLKYADGGPVSPGDTIISRRISPPDKRKKLQRAVPEQFKKYTIQQQNRIIDLMRDGYTFHKNDNTGRPILKKGNLQVVASFGMNIPIRNANEPT